MLQRDQRAVDLGLDVRDVAAVVVLVLVADDDVAVSVVRGKAVVEEFDERRALIAALRVISVAVFEQRRAALINCAAAQALEGVVKLFRVSASSMLLLLITNLEVYCNINQCQKERNVCIYKAYNPY